MLLHFAAAAVIGHYRKGWNFAAGWILFLDSKKNTNVENWRLSLITRVLSCLVHDATSEVVPGIEGGATSICVKIESIRLSKYCAAYYSLEHKPPKKWKEIFRIFTVKTEKYGLVVKLTMILICLDKKRELQLWISNVRCS